MDLRHSLTLLVLAAGLAHAARIDHVVIASTDVEAAARVLSEKYGFANSGQSGYNGNGLRTVVIPLGSSFLQLVQLTPQAAQSKNPFNQAVKEAATSNSAPFVTFAIAPSEEFGALSMRLNSQNSFYRSPDAIGPYPSPSWNVTGAESILNPPLPFFIHWSNEEQQSGSKMAAYSSSASQSAVMPLGIAYLELAGDVAAYNKWVGTNAVPVRWNQQGTSPGIVSVAVDTAEGRQVILKAAELFAPLA